MDMKAQHEETTKALEQAVGQAEIWTKRAAQLQGRLGLLNELLAEEAPPQESPKDE